MQGPDGTPDYRASLKDLLPLARNINAEIGYDSRISKVVRAGGWWKLLFFLPLLWLAEPQLTFWGRFGLIALSTLLLIISFLLLACRQLLVRAGAEPNTYVDLPRRITELESDVAKQKAAVEARAEALEKLCQRALARSAPAYHRLVSEAALKRLEKFKIKPPSLDRARRRYELAAAGDHGSAAGADPLPDVEYTLDRQARFFGHTFGYDLANSLTAHVAEAELRIRSQPATNIVDRERHEPFTDGEAKCRFYSTDAKVRAWNAFLEEMAKVYERGLAEPQGRDNTVSIFAEVYNDLR